MKNKRGKLITVLFVAAMSVSLFTGCSDDATITGLDEGALPELASDTRAVTDELIESDSISNFSLLAATEYSDAELKERIIIKYMFNLKIIANGKARKFL